jgi:hypothetical protein
MTNEPFLLTIPPKPDLTKPPRFLVESYTGMEHDVEPWLYSYYFWRFWDGKEDSLKDVAMRARSSADSRFKVLNQTNALKGASEKSVIYQLYEAQRTGWYRFVNEMEDVRELIEAMYEQAKAQDEDGGERYELEFILKTLLPTLESLGVPKELIVGIPTNISKARASVSTLRQMIQVNGPDMKDNMLQVLKDIPNPDITVRQFRELNKERLGREKAPPPVPASVYLVPGVEMIVIESDRTHTQAIEMATRGMVTGYEVRDGAALLRDLAQRIMPRAADMRRYRVREGPTKLEVYEANDGLTLPSPEAFQNLLMGEAAHTRFLVSQLLMAKQVATVPVYRIKRHVSVRDEGYEWLEQSAGYGVSGWNILNALTEFYRVIPFDVPSIFPGSDIWIRAEWSQVEQALGIYLCIKGEG